MADDEQQLAVPAGLAVEDGERDVYAFASRHFPLDREKVDIRGGTEITYLEGETIISRLNDAFVYGWDFQIVEGGINDEAGECWVRGRMTVWKKVSLLTRTLGADGSVTTVESQVIHPVVREQYGSQKIKRARSSGMILDIGFDLKGAGTDCLKKCASLFGVGLYLWNKEERALRSLEKRAESARAQDDGAQDGGQNGAADGSASAPAGGKLTRPPKRTGGQGSAPAQTNGGQVRPLIVNGLTMPVGFVPPFQMTNKDKARWQCRAVDCDVEIPEDGAYTIGGVERDGKYVHKRSVEEAGAVLCVSHTAAWIHDKKKAAEAAAGTAA